MKGKGLAFLAAAVVLLGAFIFFFERHQPTSDQARAQQARIFGDLEHDSVAAIDITNAYGSFRFQRDSRGWRLTHPIEGDADQAAVDGAVRALVQLDRDREFDATEVEPQAYGLDRAKAMVTLHTSSGESATMTIGDPTALDSKRAVSIDQKSVILTSGNFFPALDKDLDDWRSREVSDVSLSELAAITVDTANTTIEAVNLDGTWSLRSPVIDRADEDHLRNLLSGLSSLRVVEFVDAETDMVAMGLDDPRYSLLMVMADGTPGLSLEFGSTRGTAAATEVACRRNHSDVFWVNDRAATPLGKAAVLWRDPKVLEFDTWDVSALALTAGADHIDLNKEDGVWLLSDGAEAQNDEVQKRLNALAQLTAVDFDLMDLGTAKLGQVELSLDQIEQPVTVTFFHPLQDGGQVLVRASDRNTLMSVDAADAEEVLGDLLALRPLEPEETPTQDGLDEIE